MDRPLYERLMPVSVVVEYPPRHTWGRATHPDAVAVVDQAVELLAPKDPESPEQLEVARKRLREQTATSSQPVLVNTDEEVNRWAATLDLYVRAYPLLNQHRREASVWALMGHLFRLLTWYVFFNRISAEAEIDQLTHRFSFAKKAKKQTESECASGK